MFEEIIHKFRASIATIRGVVRTSDKLREFAFGDETETVKQLKNNEIIRELLEEVPERIKWEKYEHCGVVTHLYAIYESFVENLITEWLKHLPKLVPNYSELEKEIQNTHQDGVGRLLRERNKKKFKNLSAETVVKGLFQGLATNENYELIPEAFLFHEQNLRRNILEQLFVNAGIYKQIWNWIEKHRDVKEFIKEIRGNQNNAEIELNQFIDYRNEAAHSVVDTTLGTEELERLTYFIESLCQALAELVTYRIIEIKTTSGKAREIGQITEWFKKPRAAVALINNISLSVGDSLFLVSEESSYCRLATIESMRINDRPQQQLSQKPGFFEKPGFLAVGLKFDIDAKIGLNVIAAL